LKLIYFPATNDNQTVARHSKSQMAAPEQKVTVILQAVNATQIGKKKYTLNVSTTCLVLVKVIRKLLALAADVPIFLYFQQFAIYPDTTMAEILEHSSGAPQIDINYSLDPQFG
jgi:hypothetical protein